MRQAAAPPAIRAFDGLTDLRDLLACVFYERGDQLVHQVRIIHGDAFQLIHVEKRGFNLLAWLLPLVGVGVAAVVLGIAAWSWSRGRTEPETSPSPSLNGQGPIDPELERRVDEELIRLE